MSFLIKKYIPDQYDIWDEFCRNAINATFLHSRKFLAYHGNRFHDESIMIYHQERLVGVMPAAQDLQAQNLVVSHPGISYGGIVHQGFLHGQNMLEAMMEVVEYYKIKGYAGLYYKPLPYAFAVTPAQDDLYAMYRLNAVLVRCDLTNIIDLSSKKSMSDRRKRGIAKANRHVKLEYGIKHLPELWPVVNDNLERKHNLVPVHNLDEITILAELFPDNVQIRIALINEKVEAGLVLFNSSRFWHSQYSCSSEIGYKFAAMDLLLNAAITDAALAEARFFDLGISTDQAGTVINNGLFQYKSEFGGGAMVHEFYRLNF